MYYPFLEPGDTPDAGADGPLVFTFSSCEVMLTACVKAFGQYGRRVCESALYYLDGSYRLIVYPPPGPHGTGACGPLLSEYAHLSAGGALAAAFVAEHGRPIAEARAIDTISYYLT